MKLTTLTAASFWATQAAGHYIWNQLDIGGTTGSIGQGIRPNSNYNSPVIDLTSSDLRCNVGGLSGSSTVVRDIQAGGSFTFHTDVAVYHQGPVSVYLSKAPSSVQSYDGSGSWAKIADLGPTFNGNSVTWPLAQTYTFKLPTCLPDGGYLLRIQQLGIHNPWPAGIPQFYIACAHIKVTGGSNTAAWKPSLTIPGVFKETDPGYTVNIYQPEFKSYTIPGGSVMTC